MKVTIISSKEDERLKEEVFVHINNLISAFMPELENTDATNHDGVFIFAGDGSKEMSGVKSDKRLFIPSREFKKNDWYAEVTSFVKRN